VSSSRDSESSTQGAVFVSRLDTVLGKLGLGHIYCGAARRVHKMSCLEQGWRGLFDWVYPDMWERSKQSGIYAHLKR
jgi:hypothetical protein